MGKVILLVLALSSASAFAKQTLQDAIQLSPQLGVLVEAIEKSSKVECLKIESFPMTRVMGPEGKKAVTHQVACYDPNAFNPDQLGQLSVTYYGDGETHRSDVGDVIEIKFEVYK